MSVSLKSVGAITLFVDDPQRSKSFYQDVFGLKGVYEDPDSAVLEFENMAINLLAMPAAHDLIAPAVPGGHETGSRFIFSIWVDDVDEVCAELHAHGVVLLNGPVNREWGKRTASFTDPDGHIWEVAQDLPPAEGA